MMNAMLFEGPVLEDVLHEARLCFGPNLEIEAANRVRRGGLMGFFATEWYEVWARPPAGVIDNPALALLEDGDTDDTFQQMVRNAMADRSLHGDEPNPAEAYEAAMDQFFDERVAPPRRQPVPVAADPGPAVVGHERPPALVGATTAAVTAAPVLTTAPVASTLAAPPPAPVAPAPTGDRAPSAAATILTAAGPIPVVERSPIETPASVAFEDAPRGSSVFDEPRAPRTDLLWAMLDRLESVPAAPALPATGVVAFVGGALAALDCVRALGARTGSWNGNVTVLTRAAGVEGIPEWAVVHDVEELASRVDRWRQREVVGAVVIDQGMDAGDRAWAVRALDTLAPEQVRLVVEAWRLPDEVGRMAGKLGGVDALELVEVRDSVEPLAMLDLELPVSSVEGRPATPELLAAVWLENRRRV